MENTIFFSMPGTYPKRDSDILPVLRGTLCMAEKEFLEKHDLTRTDMKEYDGPYNISSLLDRGARPAPRLLQRGKWLPFFKEETPKMWALFGPFLEDYADGFLQFLRVPKNYETLAKEAVENRAKIPYSPSHMNEELSEEEIRRLTYLFKTLTGYYDTKHRHISERFRLHMDSLKYVLGGEAFLKREHLVEKDFLGVLERDYFDAYKIFGKPLKQYVLEGTTPSDQEMRKVEDKRIAYEAEMYNRLKGNYDGIIGDIESFLPPIENIRLTPVQKEIKNTLARLKKSKDPLEVFPTPCDMRNSRWDRLFKKDFAGWQRAVTLRSYLGFKTEETPAPSFEEMPQAGEEEKDGKKLHHIWKDMDVPDDFGSCCILDGLALADVIDFERASSFKGGDVDALRLGEMQVLAQELCKFVRRDAGPESPLFKAANQVLKSLQR